MSERFSRGTPSGRRIVCPSVSPYQVCTMTRVAASNMGCGSAWSSWMESGGSVDEDLGAPRGGVTRAGFEQMVAEVCLGKVGAVAAREVSRFARNRGNGNNCEVCRVVDTLLIDHDMVYDPARHQRFQLAIAAGTRW